jgi:hypothetical protein
MAAAASSSALWAGDDTGLKDLSTEAFVKAYSKLVGKKWCGSTNHGRHRADQLKPGSIQRARCTTPIAAPRPGARRRRAPQRSRTPCRPRRAPSWSPCPRAFATRWGEAPGPAAHAHDNARLWAGGLGTPARAANRACPARAQVEEALQLLQSTLAEGDGGEAPSGPEVDAALALAFDALRTCAQLAQEAFAATREQAPPPLCEAAQLLHTHALLALELAPAVQDAVARLCCAWWLGSGPDKEELLSQTLPFLLVR